TWCGVGQATCCRDRTRGRTRAAAAQGAAGRSRPDGTGPHPQAEGPRHSSSAPPAGWTATVRAKAANTASAPSVWDRWDSSTARGPTGHVGPPPARPWWRAQRFTSADVAYNFDWVETRRAAPLANPPSP